MVGELSVADAVTEEAEQRLTWLSRAAAVANSRGLRFRKTLTPTGRRRWSGPVCRRRADGGGQRGTRPCANRGAQHGRPVTGSKLHIGSAELRGRGSIQMRGQRTSALFGSAMLDAHKRCAAGSCAVRQNELGRCGVGLTFG